MQNSEHLPEEQATTNQSATNQPSSVPPVSQVPQAPQQPPVPDHDAIRQGLVYPPPPSFYDQQFEPQKQQEQPSVNTWGAPPATPPPGYPRYGQGQGYLPPHPGGQPPFPGIPGQPVPKQKKGGWFWALWIVFTLVILASCGLCTWGVSTYYSSALGAGNGTDVVNQYYSALQSQDYAQAYSYLSTTTASQNQFIQAAQQADAQEGVVQSYTSKNLQVKAIGTANNIQFVIDVDVTRQHKSYTTRLSLGIVNQHWKILSYNRI